MSGLLKEVDLIGNELPWLKDLRQRATDAFLSVGIPTPKTEAWKYTKPNRFFDEDYIYNPHGKTEVDLREISLPFDAYQIRFENGVLQKIDESLPEEIEVLPIIEALMFGASEKIIIGKQIDLKSYPFAALNTAYLNEGISIKISQDINLKKPIVLVYHTAAEEQRSLYNLRNLIVVEKGADAEIIEYYCYDGPQKSAYFNNVVNEIYVKDNASLKHEKVQTEAFKAAHVALNAVNVSQDGRYKSFCLQTGADLARNETKVSLAREGASAQVDGAYIMSGWATLDTTTNIEHLVPHTTSNQLVKGVVGGQAKGVFQGKIHIAPQAIKTEGYQLHKALLLSDDAEIDVKPELEIFADDVKCSHGAACGQLDKEQLFYMRSRGIGEDEAKQLLIDAYLNDVIAKVDDEKIKDWIKSFLMV